MEKNMKKKKHFMSEQRIWKIRLNTLKLMERNKTGKNKSSITVSDTISVKSGYYYRVISFHSATKNGKTETGSATSLSLYVG